MPVGKCLILTPLSTLLTFCPPFPPLLIVVITNSASGTSTSTISSSSKTGTTSTPANVVCRLLFELNGDNLTNLCAPFSPRNQPNALGPSTKSSTDLNPTTSPADVSSVVALNSIRSAWRRYIRRSISTQSQASVPPAPAVRIILAGLSSSDPFRSDSNSYNFPSERSLAAAVLHSSTIIWTISVSSLSSLSSSMSDNAAVHSPSNSFQSVIRSSSLFLADRSWFTFLVRGSLGSFQKSGSDDSRSRSEI
mmetsp:Transcript_7671/g.11395  ORF Transcript_7671/g.11395 Transcript_7671/m.11395 type:complete len:250 (+) Transcript_7671:349-1098(+)